MLESIFNWTTLWYFLFFIYFFACLGLIAIVLWQKGKGTGFAGAFGVGPGSDTVFGPRSRQSLPVRLTYIMAGIFMVISLCLSLINGKIIQGSAPDIIQDSGASKTDSAANDAYKGLFNGTPATAPAPVEGASGMAPTATAPATTKPAEATTTPAETPAEPAPAPAAPTPAPASTPSGQ